MPLHELAGPLLYGFTYCVKPKAVIMAMIAMATFMTTVLNINALLSATSMVLS